MTTQRSAATGREYGGRQPAGAGNGRHFVIGLPRCGGPSVLAHAGATPSARGSEEGVGP